VGEPHRLRALQMGVAGQHRVEVLGGSFDQDAPKLQNALLGGLGNIAQIEGQVGRDLVVAASARVESARDVDADDLPQAGLDVHMDVLEGRIEREGTVFDLCGDLREALDQCAFVLG